MDTFKFLGNHNPLEPEEVALQLAEVVLLAASEGGYPANRSC